jgi:hypothetical protein
MIPPRDFLEQQCQNLETNLSEALRFEYGPSESGKFFQECRLRLEILKEQVSSLSAASPPEDFQLLATDLVSLGALINRIEHAHVGEFSWAFADELRSVAEQACIGDDPTLFYISSSGSLDAYEIHPEQNDTNMAKARIYNIVLPRALRHHTLYHPVLGHEVGHAFLDVPAHSTTEKAVGAAMFEEGPLKDLASFKPWMEQRHPEMVRLASDALLDRTRRTWRVEIFCDLFALTVMGPCFSSALLTMLGAFDATGENCSWHHPPPKTRGYVQDVAAKTYGWNKPSERVSPDVAKAIEQLWQEVQAYAVGDLAASLVSEAQIKAGATLLRQRLEERSLPHFVAGHLEPLEELFDQLLSLVPPIGKQDFDSGRPAKRVDFRTIIYSGWLAWKHLASTAKPEPNFFNINRLCEHAVMQQRGIATFLEAQPPAPTVG